jgi:nucleoside-diphosphate-sugar epimerase
MQLRSMSVDRLIGLRENVEAALNRKIAGARSELQSRLKALSNFGGTEKRPVSVLDPSRARTELGWAARVAFTEGVRRTLDGMQSAKQPRC